MLDIEIDWLCLIILISGLIYFIFFIFIRRVFVVDKYDDRVKYILKLIEENCNSYNFFILF